MAKAYPIWWEGQECIDTAQNSLRNDEGWSVAVAVAVKIEMR